jgi:dihydroorotate dehydrogenase (NAD+) catalytic subunit
MKTNGMRVTIPGRGKEHKNLVLDNPVIAASGTFGFGREYAEYIDLDQLGAIAVKGLTPAAREGNPTPRIVETEMGIINSIGLQNPGVENIHCRGNAISQQYKTKVIANISGNSVEEFVFMSQRLSMENGVDALEVNVSCPNIHRGGEVFATNPDMVEMITSAVRKATDLPSLSNCHPM